jgi:hypothetical protein
MRVLAVRLSLSLRVGQSRTEICPLLSFPVPCLLSYHILSSPVLPLPNVFLRPVLLPPVFSIYISNPPLSFPVLFCPVLYFSYLLTSHNTSVNLSPSRHLDCDLNASIPTRHCKGVSTGAPERAGTTPQYLAQRA